MIIIFFLFVNYGAKIFIKYPFTFPKICEDTIENWRVDSVLSNVTIEVKIFRKEDNIFEQKEGILNDSGFTQIDFDYWSDGKEIEISDIENMEIYLPDAHIVHRTGEEVNLLPLVFKNVNFMQDTIKLVLPEHTVLSHHFNLYFGKYNDTQISYKFVVISDPHVAYHCEDHDFGTSGYNDDTIPNQTTPALNTVLDVVAAVNYLAKNDPKVKFVILTGDITESAEKSEVKKAYRIFTKRLRLICIPTLGNHDLWPYSWWCEFCFLCNPFCPSGGQEHGEGSIIEGGYFYGSGFEGFKQVYLKLQNYLPIPFWEAGPYLLEYYAGAAYPYKTFCSNFSFQYYNNIFIGTDFGSRTHAPWPCHGVEADADPIAQDITPSLIFLNEKMAYGYQKKLKTIIVDHHPLKNWTAGAFNPEEIEIINDHGVEENDNIYFRKLIAWISGHTHEVKSYVTKRDDKRVTHVYESGCGYRGDYIIYNVYDDILNMEINSPLHIIAGKPVEINCTYDYQGSEYIPSTYKWYIKKKDEVPYIIREKPPPLFHTFESAGVYRITLAIYTTGGTISTVSETIRVLAPPVITLNYPNSPNIVLEENKTYPITYTITSEDSIRKVEAWYSPDNGNTWTQCVGTKEYQRPFPTDVTNHTIDWFITQEPTIEGKIKLKVITAGWHEFEKEADYSFKIIPARPTNLSATCSYPYTSVILTWNDNSSYDEQYEIWAKKQGESDFHFLTSVPGNGSQTGSMSCEVQVERFNDYYFKVRAKKGNVYSEFSNSRWVTSSPVLVLKNEIYKCFI